MNEQDLTQLQSALQDKLKKQLQSHLQATQMQVDYSNKLAEISRSVADLTAKTEQLSKPKLLKILFGLMVSLSAIQIILEIVLR